MLTFLKTNIGLILLVAGIVVPFALSVYEKISEKKRTRVVLILISTGFIITLCSIIIMNIQERNNEKIFTELEQKKKEMITNISKNVSASLETSINALEVSKQSLTLLEDLESRLGRTSLGEVAVSLNAPDYDNLHVFEKGRPGQIPDYVSWLDETLQQPGKAPAISLTLNANRHYFLELILAYLLADKNNVDIVKTNLGRTPRDWRKFPDDATLSSLGRIKSGVRYVLFYDRNKNSLMGFADATILIRELLLYKKLRLSKDIEAMFNRAGNASVSKMQLYFSSFNPMVFKADNAYDAARILIENKVNEGVAFDKKNPWFISLALVIKLAI
jgi:hypothetical protein